MERFKHILIPIDFSPPSREAMRGALDLAQRDGARVDLLHVFEPPDFPAWYGASAQKIFGEMPDIRQAARDVLHAWLTEAKGRYAHVATHFREGHPASEIVQAAEALDSDLIVVSTHGHTGLRHVLLGSVAEHVVRHAPCPVLVLRAFPAGSDDSDASAVSDTLTAEQR